MMHANDRRQFIRVSLSTLASGICMVGAEEEDPDRDGKEKEKPVKMGLVTDIHYADKPARGTRHYRESLGKLREAVALFREQGVDLVIELGDLVDAASTAEEERGFLTVAKTELSKVDCPVHYVLGNHCLANFTKKEFLEVVKVDREIGHYSFDVKGLHGVILDACFTGDMKPYARGNFSWSDANVPMDQQQWLKKDLEDTELPVVVFVHQRLDLEIDSAYAIKQSAEVRKVFEASGKVRAVLQGHSHKNAMTRINGIPYITMAAIVEGATAKENSYAILSANEEGDLSLEGYRKQTDYDLSSSW